MPKGPIESAFMKSRSRHVPIRFINLGTALGSKLVVDAVEDDGERSPDNQELLVSRPASVINHRADINCLHQVRSSMT